MCATCFQVATTTYNYCPEDWLTQTAVQARTTILGLIPAGEHCAIFSRQDSVTCLGEDTFALSETPQYLGSTSWGTACPRIATYAWFRINRRDSHPSDRDHCVLHLNTHLDHQSEEARVEGSRLIVKKLEELEDKGPPLHDCLHAGTVVTGDFNCWQQTADGACSEVFDTFESAGFHDACSVKGSTACPFTTFHSWKPRAAAIQRPGTRADGGMTHGHIDWILWRGSSLKLVDFTVVTRSFMEVPPSDHFPVVVRFAIADSQTSGQ
eukprot:TRINITY_DN15677_c0_g1_i2.p1 TRINITY_DN15677_c0_g1~~TRINITY_DN15677_c0_g1_i2.p1  ORF type:complete len:266 (-),score=36.11 TRINITY_DN15677_c0_g1_i2:124-921(-)